MLRLVIEFFKIGLFAIGGGMATIPFLQELARKYPWFTDKDLLDMIAISESTPGAIGINISTYAGYNAYGLPGAILATIALITGPIIIILMISKAMDKFKNSKIVADMFVTIRPATAGLILGAMSSVMAYTLLDIDKFKLSGSVIDLVKVVPVLLFATYLFILKKFDKLHPISIIIASGIFGVIFKL